jgi:predicted PurR-regulated permease PerM
MAVVQLARNQEKDYLRRAVEVSIHVGLLISFAVACVFIMHPFLPLFAWGVIISLAVYPVYCWLQDLLGGRRGLAAVVCTLLLLAVSLVPVMLLTSSLVEGIQILVARIREGTPIIPSPPPRINNWPIIGVRLKDAWELASKNLSALLQMFAPQIKSAIPGLLSASAGIGLAMLKWIISIMVAGVLLAKSAKGAEIARTLANRLFGEKGPEIAQLAGATIRSVATGVLGVSFIQSFLAAMGFLAVGLPGAGLWAVIFLVAAVLQVGVLVLIPAVIYIFTVASTTKAVIFLVWCAVVGILDNVLKPLLLGRGVPVPMLVVFLGAIGGIVMMGTIGLFVGAIVLSMGYALFVAWLERPAETMTDA